MKTEITRNGAALHGAKGVVHARVGLDGCEVLEELAKRQGVSITQALRNLLEDARQRMAEEAFGPRLESMSRTLLAITEQQARLASRIESLVAILRKVEEGQVAREGQIQEVLTAALGLEQLTYAHLLGIVETSPRAADIQASAKTKIRALRGEG